MPRYIIKLDGKYLEWSTVVDAPVTDGMNREDFERWYESEYGRGAMLTFEARMERVEKKGTSSEIDESVDSLIEYNRAGDGEACLTKQQIIDLYVNPKS